MDSKEVVDLIQFYRHELLNHLQVIHGYTKLGNKEKVEMNLNKLFESLHKERELLGLGIPNVFIWIFKCKMTYQQFNISYSVAIENLNIAASDEYIAEKLEETMQKMERKYKEEKVYSVHIAFKENKSNGMVEISIDDKSVAQFEVFTS